MTALCFQMGIDEWQELFSFLNRKISVCVQVCCVSVENPEML